MKAVVIGGGIIGLCSAWYLQEDGWEVTILDKDDLLSSCSYGNMGLVVPSHFVPLAAPGMVAKGIRWMFNSRSPFYVKPRLSSELLSWGMQFVKSATAAKVEQAAIPLRDINLLSQHLYEQLATVPGLNFGMEKKGVIMYYKTPAVAAEEAHLAAKAVQMGLDAVVLDKAGLQQLEPAVKLDVLGGVHYRCDAHLYPNDLMYQLLTALRARGVKILPGQAVENITYHNRHITNVVTAQDTYSADLFVLAAGSWSAAIARMVGLRMPLQPGKGYSVTLDAPAVNLQVPAILCEARVALTPMLNKLRYGGTMEIAPVNKVVNMKRVEGIVRSIGDYFENLNISMPDQKEVWYGFRPCTPDGLPYIGYAKGYDNLLMAGGHAMMGLSLGPATGKLVSELAINKPTSITIARFDPNRF
jgi:D-amino-acid dehydrogenase